MAEPVSLDDYRGKLEREVQEQQASLKSGGGGGTSGGMEARVAKLEGQFEKLNDKIDELRIDVAVLKERVGNLPGKGFIVTATLTGLAVFSAIVLFEDRLSALLAG